MTDTVIQELILITFFINESREKSNARSGDKSTYSNHVYPVKYLKSITGHLCPSFLFEKTGCVVNMKLYYATSNSVGNIIFEYLKIIPACFFTLLSEATKP